MASPSDHYDAIVVGARAAGAATGMLLARAGLRVLIVDRDRYGDDTQSTHALMRGGVMQLHRWGLLDRVVAAGTPPVRRTTFHLVDEALAISIKPAHGVDALYAPRRTVLDPLLADAAAEAGAELRFGTTVTDLVRAGDGRVAGVSGRDESGATWRATATVTIGADGRSSRIAHWAGAPVERLGAGAGSVAYGYWSGVEVDGYQWCFRPGVAAGIIPTNGGQACVFVGTDPQRFRAELVHDVDAGYRSLLAEAAPTLLDQLAAGRSPDRLQRFPGHQSFLRGPWGPGWALVGDAGYFKDPMTAHGLTDAIRDAELLARAVIDALVHGQDEAVALAGYAATRNRLSDQLFTVTDAVASYAWDADEIRALLLQLSSAMTDEVELLAGLDDDVSALAS